MSDEPLELPLFESDDTPSSDEAGDVDPDVVVVETIDLDAPEPEATPPSATEDALSSTLITGELNLDAVRNPEDDDRNEDGDPEGSSGGEEEDNFDPLLATTLPQRKPAGLVARLVAGSIDLVVHVATAGLLIAGADQLGVEVQQRHLLPLAIVMAAFAFVYHLVPLTFWGRTPGMAVTGLRARAEGDLPVSIPQAIRRFVGVTVTVATAGLGTLLALSGRSLADRISGTWTWKA